VNRVLDQAEADAEGESRLREAVAAGSSKIERLDLPVFGEPSLWAVLGTWILFAQGGVFIEAVASPDRGAPKGDVKAQADTKVLDAEIGDDGDERRDNEVAQLRLARVCVDRLL